MHCCCAIARALECSASVAHTDMTGCPSPLLLAPCPLPQLAESEHRAWFDLLKVFAYGTYADYKATPGLPELGEAETTKLRQLTLVQMASKQRVSRRAVAHARTGLPIACGRHPCAVVAEIMESSRSSLSSSDPFLLGRCLSQILPYSLLQSSLSLPDLRTLEDLIIESIYLGLIEGHLNQKDSTLEITSAIGRDIGPNDVDNMIQQLSSWLVQA